MTVRYVVIVHMPNGRILPIVESDGQSMMSWRTEESAIIDVRDIPIVRTYGCEVLPVEVP